LAEGCRGVQRRRGGEGERGREAEGERSRGAEESKAYHQPLVCLIELRQ
jgi:hypothetical protein